MDELGRVLVEKFAFNMERWREVEMFLAELATGIVPAPEQPVELVSGDPDDDVVLASAVQAGVETLISGDRRHLLPLKSHRGVRIVTPQALLAELRHI